MQFLAQEGNLDTHDASPSSTAAAVSALSRRRFLQAAAVGTAAATSVALPLETAVAAPARTGSLSFTAATNGAATLSPSGDRLIAEVQNVLWSVARKGGEAVALTPNAAEPSVRRTCPCGADLPVRRACPYEGQPGAGDGPGAEGLPVRWTRPRVELPKPGARPGPGLLAPGPSPRPSPLAPGPSPGLAPLTPEPVPRAWPPYAGPAARVPAEAMPSQVCGLPSQHQPSFGAF
ncbi:twin-arginine translocation signal domain-containing protein [Streptomyces hygroscopicus]|uniref:twin-arginine translocation signal domain-containing protein n=1 Tax=Streptomyces hygroscopicus TaxID=1912 RepID=UPI003F4D25C6